MSEFHSQIDHLSQEELKELLTELHASGDPLVQDFLELRLSVKQGQAFERLKIWFDKFPFDSSPKALNLQEAIFLLNHLETSKVEEGFILTFLKAATTWEKSDENTQALQKLSLSLSKFTLTLPYTLAPQKLFDIFIADQDNRLSYLLQHFQQLASHKDLKQLWQNEQSKIEIFKLRQDLALVAHYSELFTLLSLSYNDFDLAEKACQITHKNLNEHQRLLLAERAFDQQLFDQASKYLKASFPKLLVDKLKLQEKIYTAQNDTESLKENLLSQFQIQPDLKRYNKLENSQLITEDELQKIALEKAIEDKTIQRSLRLLHRLGEQELILSKTITAHDDFELIFCDELQALYEEFQDTEKLVSLTCLRALLVQGLQKSSYNSQKSTEKLWQKIQDLSEAFKSLPEGYLSPQNFRQELYYRFPEAHHFLI